MKKQKGAPPLDPPLRLIQYVHNMLKFICSKFVYLDGKDEVSACFPVSLPHGMGGCNHVLPHTLGGTCGVHV